MAYNEKLANRVREALLENGATKVEEKLMMGGVCFMVKGKMCLGITNNDLMARIGPDAYHDALNQPGCREMDFTGKPMRGYVFVDDEGRNTQKRLNHWVKLALDFNSKAKASKKKKAK